jgi:hypothetical protein
MIPYLNLDHFEFYIKWTCPALNLGLSIFDSRDFSIKILKLGLGDFGCWVGVCQGCKYGIWADCITI